MRLLLTLGCFVILGACHRTNRQPKIFFGECQIEIVSLTKGATILLDGIGTGSDHVLLDTPCGEKQVRVEKKGYTSYLAYMPVRAGEPIKVTVELKHPEAVPDYATSSELVEQIVAGRKIRDPWTEPLAPGEKDVDETFAAPVAADTQEEATQGGATGGTAAFSENVEDWR